MPLLSQAIDFLIHFLAFVMAILEFLLNCFRRRRPSSEQSRPLCTEEDSAQPEITSDLPSVVHTQTEDTHQTPATPTKDPVRTFAGPSAQHDSPPQQLKLGQDSSFGFAEMIPGGFTPQVSNLIAYERKQPGQVSQILLSCTVESVFLQSGHRSSESHSSANQYLFWAGFRRCSCCPSNPSTSAWQHTRSCKQCCSAG